MVKKEKEKKQKKKERFSEQDPVCKTRDGNFAERSKMSVVLMRACSDVA